MIVWSVSDTGEWDRWEVRDTDNWEIINEDIMSQCFPAEPPEVIKEYCKEWSLAEDSVIDGLRVFYIKRTYGNAEHIVISDEIPMLIL